MSSLRYNAHTQDASPNSRRSGLLEPSATVAITLVLLTVTIFGVIRYRLRDMPLERDEGEYAYAGQLMLQGVPPYKLAYNMKLPGIYAAYALILAIFGQTPAGIHIGLLIINAATTLLLCFLGAFLLGRLAAVVAASSYALLSTSTSVMGFEAHATNFVVLPAILSILLLLYASRSQRLVVLFFSGLAAGVAFLMKQHGLFFVVFGVYYLVQIDRRLPLLLRRLTVFSVGVILPYALTCLLLARAGVFRQFWFWTVSYAGEYSKIGTHRAIRALLENSRSVIRPALPLWILAAVGVTAIVWSATARKHSAFLGGLLVCSFLALCPGAYFRPHYFVLLLPVVAIFIGIAVVSGSEKLAGRLALIPVAVFLLCYGSAVFAQRKPYFSMNSEAVFEDVYPGGPFFAARQAAGYVQANSAPAARIAVLGSEPEIYFYARRHSATGYLYMYSLTERQKYTAQMRDQMMQELETNSPEFVVYVDEWGSWGNRYTPYNVPFVARLREFMDEHYERVQSYDIPRTGIAPDNDGQSSAPVPRIYVLKRRS